MTKIANNIEVTNSGTNTSLKLIRQAANEGYLKQLAFFHLVKFTFNNSCVYAYRSRMPELANTFNVSTQTLYRYIAILRQKELIYGHSNNLVYKSIKTIKKDLSDKRKCLINLKKTDSLWEIQCRLNGKLIEEHLRRIVFMESIRRFGNSEGRIPGFTEMNSLPSLSIRNIAKLLKIHEPKAIKIIRTLSELAIIRTIKQAPRLLASNANGINPSHLTDYPGYKFLINGKLFVQYGQKIESIEFPINPPKITLKQFKTIYKSIQSKNSNNLYSGIDKS